MADRAVWLHRITILLWTVAFIIALATLVTVATDLFPLDGAMTLSEASEQTATPYDNTPWYLTGTLPIFLGAPPFALLAAAVYALRGQSIKGGDPQ